MMQKVKYLLLAGVFLVLAAPVLGQGNKAQAPGQVKKQAVVGTVEDIDTTDSTVTVDQKGKGKKQVDVESSTEIVSNGKSVKLGAVKLKDLIAVIGTDSAGLATPGGKIKKIFVKSASSSAQLKRKAVMGVIIELGDGEMTLAHQNQRSKTYKVVYDANTLITGKDASGSGSLAVGQRVTAVGDLVEEGIMAKRIHIIPGKATGVFNKQPVSTGSASPTVSVSATPTEEVTPTEEPELTSTPTTEPTATPTAEPAI